MTGIEALELLRSSHIKVKRAEWKDNEYLRAHDHSTCVYPSPVYHRRRGEDCYYPEDAVTLVEEILNDFLQDDWEVVE
jgi:hypothetical protein